MNFVVDFGYCCCVVGYCGFGGCQFRDCCGLFFGGVFGWGEVVCIFGFDLFDEQ